jgi:hypothetical protein
MWGRAPRGNGARLAITLFALFAFTLQTYVTQTHIHGMARINSAAATLAFDKNAAHKQQPGKFPPGDDPANCPICQEILHTGLFVTPSAAALLLPTVAVSIAAIVVDIKTIVQAPSHSWKSRAPPLA